MKAPNDDSKRKLEAAASELVKAASLHAGSNSTAEGKETVRLLKRLSTVVNKSMEELEYTMNKNRKTLDDSIDRLTNVIREKDKRERLEWAIANSETSSFMFYYGDDDDLGECSSAYVKEILLEFRQGASGVGLKDAYIDTNDEKGREMFRCALRSQISILTGVQSRLRKHGAHGYCIYYS